MIINLGNRHQAYQKMQTNIQRQIISGFSMKTSFCWIKWCESKKKNLIFNPLKKYIDMLRPKKAWYCRKGGDARMKSRDPTKDF